MLAVHIDQNIICSHNVIYTNIDAFDLYSKLQKLSSKYTFYQLMQSLGIKSSVMFKLQESSTIV